MLNRRARFGAALITAFVCGAAWESFAATIRLERRYELKEQFGHILSADVGPDGSIVVADYDQPRLMEFDPRGTRRRTFSRPGRGHCEFNGPRAIAYSGKSVVAWDKRHQLYFFGPDGSCRVTPVMLTYEVMSGALLTDGKTFVGGGNLFAKPQQSRVCVFFKFEEGSIGQPRCLLWMPDVKYHLLYARQYVARRGSRAWFMEAYSPELWAWNGTGVPARKTTLPLNLPAPEFPENELRIRATRNLFFEFYIRHHVVEGIAATDRGLVVATRVPAKQAHRLMLRYFPDGATASTAEITADLPPPVGGYPVHVRSGPGNRVYVLAARGKWPELRYEVLVYQITG